MATPAERPKQRSSSQPALTEPPTHSSPPRRTGAFQRFRENGPAMLGLALVGALGLFAILGPVAAGWDPNESDIWLVRGPLGTPPGPSAAHWLGVDDLFRDVFARLACGGRISLGVAVAATFLSTAIGTVIGLVSGMTHGTRAGAVDTAMMRLVDVLLALPFLLLVTAIGVAVGRTDIGTVLLVLGLLGWTGTARLVRAKTLQIRELDFVAAARALGGGPIRVALRHVLPNLHGPIIVVATNGIGQMILAEAVLGYLTVGVQPPQATWGRMLHEGERYLTTGKSLVLIPGFAILLSVLAWNRVGDGLHDAFGSTLGGGTSPQPRAGGSRLPVDLLLTVAALLLLSIAPPGPVAAPLGIEPTNDVPRRGGVVRAATFVNIRTLDPALAFDDASRPLIELAFARLVTWDGAGNIIPDLARSVTPSSDLRTYTFEMREGAHFHDGTPVLAADVKRSFERLLHPKTPTPSATMYEGIRGYAAFHGGREKHLDGVRVLGDRLVAIELDAPDATFLAKLTLGFAAPVCASAGAFADPSTDALPCGAGPFRVVSWEPDKGARFTRHEGYHAPGRPYLDGIEWSINVPPTTQRYKFERGELDIVRELTATDGDLFRATPAWARLGHWTENPTTNAVFLNTELPPFDQRAVRRAVSFALDPGALTHLRADLIEANRVIPPSIPGPRRRPPMRRHDPRAALEEMARAGYPFDPVTGRGGYPRPIDFIAVPDTADQQAAELYQQQLARIGIRIRLRLVTFASYLAETQRRRTAPMGRAGWWADFPDPSNFFEPTLSSKAIQDETSENVSFFANRELDALLDRAHAEPDQERRFLAYERAEEIIRDEAPWIPTYGSRTFELLQPYVRGSVPQAVAHAHFEDIWLDRGGHGPLSAAIAPWSARPTRSAGGLP